MAAFFSGSMDISCFFVVGGGGGADHAFSSSGMRDRCGRLSCRVLLCKNRPHGFAAVTLAFRRQAPLGVGLFQKTLPGLLRRASPNPRAAPSPVFTSPRARKARKCPSRRGIFQARMLIRGGRPWKNRLPNEICRRAPHPEIRTSSARDAGSVGPRKNTKRTQCGIQAQQTRYGFHRSGGPDWPGEFSEEPAQTGTGRRKANATGRRSYTRFYRAKPMWRLPICLPQPKHASAERTQHGAVVGLGAPLNPPGPRPEQNKANMAAGHIKQRASGAGSAERPGPRAPQDSRFYKTKPIIPSATTKRTQPAAPPTANGPSFAHPGAPSRHVALFAPSAKFY
jgi:hypothetical protein